LSTQGGTFVGGTNVDFVAFESGTLAVEHGNDPRSLACVGWNRRENGWKWIRLSE
jgi:hypothetical protein